MVDKWTTMIMDIVVLFRITCLWQHFRVIKFYILSDSKKTLYPQLHRFLTVGVEVPQTTQRLAQNLEAMR